MLQRYCGKNRIKTVLDRMESLILNCVVWKLWEVHGRFGGSRRFGGSKKFIRSVGVWKSQSSWRSRGLGRFKRNMTNVPGGLEGTEGQEVSGRSRGSGRFRRSDTF